MTFGTEQTLKGATDAGFQLSRGHSQLSGGGDGSCAVGAVGPSTSWRRTCHIPPAFYLPALPSYGDLRIPSLAQYFSEENTVGQPLQPQLGAEGDSPLDFTFPEDMAAHAGQTSPLNDGPTRPLNECQ